MNHLPLSCYEFIFCALTPWPLTFCWNYQGCAESSCAAPERGAGWERGRAGSMARTGAQQRQRAEIALEEVHSYNNIAFPAIFFWLQSGSLYLIGLKLDFKFWERTKDFPGWLVWRITKNELYSGTDSYPLFSFVAALIKPVFVFFCKNVRVWVKHVHHQLDPKAEMAICQATGNSFCLFSPPVSLVEKNTLHW